MQQQQPAPSLISPDDRRLLRPVFIAGVILLLLSQIGICRSGFAYAMAGAADFRALYAAGYIVRTGHAAQLYDYDFEHTIQNAVVSTRTGALPCVYPPYAALLFVPLSLLGYRAAYAVFLVCNVMLAAMAAALLRPRLPLLASVWRPLPFVITLGFWPLAVVLLQGQVSMLLLLLYCGCYVALQRGRHFLAGALLACALIKFQIALPVAVLFLLWRRWRFVGGFAAGAAACALLSLYAVGINGLAAYWHFMVSMAANISAGVTQTAAQMRYGMFPAKMSNLHGFFYLLSGGTHWGVALTIVFSIAAMLLAFAAGPSLPIALLAALLVSYHLQPHDLSLLILPIALVIEAALARRNSTRIRASAPDDRDRATRPWHRGGTLCACTLWGSAFLLLFPPVPIVLIANGLASLLAVPVAALLVCIGPLDIGLRTQPTCPALPIESAL